ncbi:hypothetical protein C0995_008028 [Termitomyces sp. Mi166|nr:hypothetical protein C0995_008028 [Termitomyces sp. Mi166\
MKCFQLLGFMSSCISVASSTTIAAIQGTRFKSLLADQNVTNVTGVVTAKWSRGFFLNDTNPPGDPRVSTGLSIVINSTITVNVGDLVSLNGTVSDCPGCEQVPPTQQLTQLDSGADDLSYPNNSTQLESLNPELQPNLYGLDFWESLEGQLVTILRPVVLGLPLNSPRAFWVHGAWNVTGKNGRGGLSITIGNDNKPDANPEAIMIGTPLDDSQLPSQVALGSTLTDITGIVYYQSRRTGQRHGFFYILPTTAPSINGNVTQVQPTTIVSNSSTISFGDYNVNNAGPNSPHLSMVADHIATYLNAPDIVFLQEIQDNSGTQDDGVVIGNITLTNLVNAIRAKASNVTYNFVEIAPVNKADGGVPGGNIRQAYLYRSAKLSLVPPSQGTGTALDGVAVTVANNKTTLNFNPGRIDPANPAWNSSRKPLVAQWQTLNNKTLFTINVHFTNKGGSSSNWGDARPPINSNVEQRTNQTQLVANFVKSILTADNKANILVAGDFNEYSLARAVFQSFTGVLTEADEVANVPPVERYTGVYAQNSVALDHAFVS